MTATLSPATPRAATLRRGRIVRTLTAADVWKAVRTPHSVARVFGNGR